MEEPLRLSLLDQCLEEHKGELIWIRLIGEQESNPVRLVRFDETSIEVESLTETLEPKPGSQYLICRSALVTMDEHAW